MLHSNTPQSRAFPRESFLPFDPRSAVLPVIVAVFSTVGLTGCGSLGNASAPQVFEAESAQGVGGAEKVAAETASGGFVLGLGKPGQSVKFAALPAASKV